MRCAVLMVLTPAMLAAADASGGSPDRVFDGISIDRWCEEHARSNFLWKTGISHAQLGHHQRLTVRFRSQIDGMELLKREGQGELLFLTQVRDRDGAVFQNHQSISLDHVDRGANANFVVHSLDAFIVPGDYEVALGLFVPSTGEHAALRRKLHVDGIPGEPFRDPWRNVPAVEFRPSKDPPEAWYLPSIEGRLNLEVETRRRIRLELLLNESPTEETKDAALGTFNRLDMGALIPAVKVLTQVDWKNGSVDVAMFNLERRRVSFEQKDVQTLDWDKLQDALKNIDPFRIDVASLQNRDQDAQFFASEVRRRVGEAEDSRDYLVFIVLSGPMAFRRGEDLRPMQGIEHGNSRLFYVRYNTMIAPYWYRPNPPRGLGTADVFKIPAPPALMADKLVRIIGPLGPRVFEVTKPEEFRKALAVMLAEISRY